MKIGGRKNDGAWFRTNVAIGKLTTAQQDDLAEQLADLSSWGDLFTTLQDFQLAAGITDGDGYIATAADLALAYSQNGIPRQVWFGRLSYDVYNRTGGPGSYEYTPAHQAVMHTVGKEVRKLMKDYLLSRRQALDLGNILFRPDGNPGGLPDTIPE